MFRFKNLVALLAVAACSREQTPRPLDTPPPVSPPRVATAVDVLTWHYDIARSGVQAGETLLAPVNVTPSTFGKKFAFTVDGDVYAQPLYVAKLPIGGVDREVLFVATQHDTVYAFDASGSVLDPLWKVSLLGPGETPVGTDDAQSKDIDPEIGITGTPVIDRARGVLYVVAKSVSGADEIPKFYQRLHALSLVDGTEQLGGPSVIAASLPGTATDAVGDVIAFEPLRHNQRAALSLIDDRIWITWAGHGDKPPYHGWVMAFDASDLQKKPLAWMTTPDGMGGGIWMASGGVTTDGHGNVFLSAGNGTFDDDEDGETRTNFGGVAVRLRIEGEQIVVADFFAPHDQYELSSTDQDFGTMSMQILPDMPGPSPHRMLTASKSGIVYMMDRDGMGQYDPTSDHVIQALDLGSRFFISNPVFFDGTLYACPSRGPLAAYTINSLTGLFNEDPTSESDPCTGTNCLKRGATPSVSANGDKDGIVWLLDTSPYVSRAPAILHAYSTANVGTELFDSSKKPTNTAGVAVKFTTPVVTNGRVYVGGGGVVTVYGLL